MSSRLSEAHGEISPLTPFGRDDKGKGARDDKGKGARDDKGKGARDDKGKGGRDDKGKGGRDDGEGMILWFHEDEVDGGDEAEGGGGMVPVELLVLEDDVGDDGKDHQ